MRCVKLLGERMMARDFNRQVAELQVRAAILTFAPLPSRALVARPHHIVAI